MEPDLMFQNKPDYYMPSDFFSRQTLELTYQLLKKENSGLSEVISNALSNLPTVPYERVQGTYTDEMLLNQLLVEQIGAHTLGRIVSCLTNIGEKSLINKKFVTDYKINLRSIIEDWMQLTEWVLLRTNTDKQDCTPYQ